MKTWLKISGCWYYWLLLAAAGVCDHLQAQESVLQYCIIFERQALSIGTSGGLCGDDYHYLGWDVTVKRESLLPDKKPYEEDGYGKRASAFAFSMTYTIDQPPEQIILTGKAGDERDNNNAESSEWNYIKGDAPRSLTVMPRQRRNSCTRSMTARYEVTVDDPIILTNTSKPISGEKDRLSTEKDVVVFHVNSFYQNGKRAVIQVREDGGSWIDVQSVTSGQEVRLSYQQIVKEMGKEFSDLWGKPLTFRALKTLLNDVQTCDSSQSVTFYPDGIQFGISSTKRTACEDGVTLTVHLENSEDSKYMHNSPGNFIWCIAQFRNDTLLDHHFCTMEETSDSRYFIIRPDPKEIVNEEIVNEEIANEEIAKRTVNPFDEQIDVEWKVQLQSLLSDTVNQAKFFCTKSFIIPAKPQQITTNQKEQQFTVNDKRYHVPNTSRKFGVLNITDPSYASHHRLPYTITIDGENVAKIWELGLSPFDNLTQQEQDTLQATFTNEYNNQQLVDTSARRNFAATQQGVLLSESVGRIAFSTDSSFFLYTRNTDSGYDLYKAILTAGKVSQTTSLITAENVSEIELTPDGKYCVYKKNGVPGLFCLSLTDPQSGGALLSDKSIADTVSVVGKELPRHIYKDTTGNWAFVSAYNNAIYSITIPGGEEKQITAATVTSNDKVHVSENGRLFYETNSGSLYKVHSMNLMSADTITNPILHPDIGLLGLGNTIIIDEPALPSAYYSYDDKYTVYFYTKINEQQVCHDACNETFPPLILNSDDTPMADASSPDIVTICSEIYSSHIAACENLSHNETNNNLYRKLTTFQKTTEIRQRGYTHQILDIAPNGQLAIIKQTGGNQTSYINVPSGNSLTASNSNIRINPNNRDVVLSNNDNIYRNTASTATLLSVGKTSSNICFSRNGAYFLYVDAITGHVYKQYMSDQAALDDTEPLFREIAWNNWINKKQGTRVYSDEIKFDTSQIWQLTDADNCIYDTFSVTITAPPKAYFTYSISQYPSTPCAADGKAIITYRGGGLSPFFYQGQRMSDIGDTIRVENLPYGNTIVSLKDGTGLNESEAITISIDAGITGITDVSVAPQNCAAPNGKIDITTANIPGTLTYHLQNISYGSLPEQSKTATSSGTVTFDSLPEGQYKIWVTSSVGCSFNPLYEAYSINNKIFAIRTITVTPAVSFNGKGQITAVFANRPATAQWESPGLQFTSQPTVEYDTFVSDPASPGTYAIAINNAPTGCRIDTTVVIEQPAIRGNIQVNCTADSCRIYAPYLGINSLAEAYRFRVKKAGGETLFEGERPVAILRTAGEYEIDLYHPLTRDSLTLYTWTFPLDTIATSLTATPPNCPDDSGAIKVTVNNAPLTAKANVLLSIDGLHYTSKREYRLPATQYYARLRDTLRKTTPAGGLTVTAAYEQPLNMVIPAREPVNATVNYTPPLCAGGNGWVKLSDYTGGSGAYKYKINENGAWQDTATIDHLHAGVYEVYLKDADYGCEQLLCDIFLDEPDSLKSNIAAIQHTTCQLNNGVLRVNADGGTAPYTFILTMAGTTFTDTLTAATPDTVSFTGLPAGDYKVSITDTNGCEVSHPLQTINGYTNPYISGATITPVSCYSGQNGKIQLTTAVSTTPVASLELYTSEEVLMDYNTTGVFENLQAGNYLVKLHDTLGCPSNTAYPVSITEPDSLYLSISSITPVGAKGTRSGKIAFILHGGNTGTKTIALQREDASTIESITGIGEAPLNFTVYAGAYTLAVTDTKGCTTATGLLQVAEPADSLRLIVKEVKDALCKSQVGSISVEGVGGWGAYRYKRESDPDYVTRNTFNKLYPGRYVISVIDSLGVTASETIVIYEPKDNLQARLVGQALPLCGDQSLLSIMLSGGTPPYRLHDNTDAVAYAQPQTVAWTTSVSGNHLLHLTDANGCRFEFEVSVPDTAQLRITEMALTYPSAATASDGAIRAVVVGGAAPYHYRWTQDLSTALPAGTDVLTDITAGYYGVEVTDSRGCKVQQSTYLTDPAVGALDIIYLRHETALGAANGAAVLHTAAPLTGYELITPENTSITYLASDSLATFDVRNNTVYLNNLSGGRWILTGRNAEGQYAVADFTINPYREFTINRIAVTHVHRPGTSGGEIRIDVQGGGGNNVYAWTSENGTPVPSVDEGNSSSIAGVPAGTYTVQVTDRYSNVLQQPIAVNEPKQALALNIAHVHHQSCKLWQDAYVVLAATGGWNDYQFRHQSEQHFSNSTDYYDLATGTHRFYLIDQQGVTDSIDVKITEPEHLRAAVAAIDSATCRETANGRALFNLTGGTAPYSLSERLSDMWQTTDTARQLSVGEHIFIFRDHNGCAGVDTLTVTIHAPDSLLFDGIHVTHTTCGLDNGAVAIGMKGGSTPYQYKWTEAITNTEVGRDTAISGLIQNGLYRLKVTDRKGCTQQWEQRINPSVKPAIVTLITTNVLCYGDSTGTAQVAEATPAEPYAPYALTWSNGDTGNFSGRFHYGQHTVTLSDSNGCTAIRYFDITQPDSLRISVASIQEPQCYGYDNGHIIIEAQGGIQDYRYAWSTGDTTSVINLLPKGEYRLTLTDANGCTADTTFILDEPEEQTVNLGGDVTICPGNIHLLDGKDYAAYRWYTAERELSTERYLRVSEAGRYFLEATDERGCPVLGEVTVAIGNSALQANFLMTSEAALGDTIVLLELSNLPLDSLRWNYPPAFEPVSETLPSYMLLLRSLQTGIYNIDMYGHSGNCFSHITKQIEITEQDTAGGSAEWNYQNTLITDCTAYPNPNNGRYTVNIELREQSDVRLILFEVASGFCINDRTERGQSQYCLTYDLPPLNTGIYILLITAGKERRQIKLLIIDNAY